MTVAKLIAHNFRNLDDTAIHFHPKMNFFVGGNGSGKSSLLEALFFLGHGKSFRTSKLDVLACHEKTNFVVSIKDSNNCQLGLRNMDYCSFEIMNKWGFYKAQSPNLYLDLA